MSFLCQRDLSQVSHTRGPAWVSISGTVGPAWGDRCVPGGWEAPAPLTRLTAPCSCLTLCPGFLGLMGTQAEERAPLPTARAAPPRGSPRPPCGWHGWARGLGNLPWTLVKVSSGSPVQRSSEWPWPGGQMFC